MYSKNISIYLFIVKTFCLVGYGTRQQCDVILAKQRAHLLQAPYQTCKPACGSQCVCS